MSFEEELEAICSSVDGARSAVLMSRDGISVAIHKLDERGPDDETMLIELVASLNQAVSAAQASGAAPLSSVDLHTGIGTIIVRWLSEEYFVALMLNPGALDGHARYVLRIHSLALEKELL